MNNIAHLNMVEQQIRPWNVSSPPIIKAIKLLDRSLFVPEDQQALCYVDTAIMLQNNAKMLEPKVAARLIQALDLSKKDRVLVVGTGSGYSGALCAKLALSVDCIDSDQSILNNAAKNCESAGVENIRFDLVADVANYNFMGKYDAILVRQPGFSAPDAYFFHLTSTGRCVALVGDDCVMEMIRYTRQGKEIKEESITDILLRLNDADAKEKAFVF